MGTISGFIQGFLPEMAFAARDRQLFLAIADTVIPSIRLKERLGGDDNGVLLSEAEYRATQNSVQSFAGPGVRPECVRQFLEERPSDLDGFIPTTDKCLATIRPQARLALVWFLRVMRTSIGGFLLTGTAQPFDELSISDREKVILSWGNSSFVPLRRLSRVLTTLCYRIWAATSPRLRPLIGMPQPASTGNVTQGAPHEFLQFRHQDQPHVLSADVVIVGSGCGASVTAKNLAEAGLDVVVVEKSYSFSDQSFPLDENQGLEYLFEGGGLLSSDDGSVGFAAGSTWGGGGTVNWSGSLQTPKWVRKEWSQGGLSVFESSEFQNSLDRVCQRMKVTTKNLDHNFANRTLCDGARKVGYQAQDLPQNTGSLGHDCDNCTFGCSSGTKQGPIKTFLVDAARAGARFIEGFNVDKILFSPRNNNRVVKGVEGYWTSRSSFFDDADRSPPQKIIIKAKQVAVCGGSLQTPLLLQRSGLTNPAIGRNLHVHPAPLVMAIFNEDLCPWKGPIMTSMMNDVRNPQGESQQVRLEMAAGIPSLFLPLFPWSGGKNAKDLASKFRHAVIFVPVSRDRDSGRVYASTAEGGVGVGYSPSICDRRTMCEGMIAAAEIAYANGAQEIYTVTSEIQAFVRKAAGDHCSFEEWIKRFRNKVSLAPGTTTFVSAHQMGTCRMSACPNDGVVDPKGQVWNTSGLFIGDTSVFPSASGVNPMITAMAIADYISRQMISKSKKPPGITAANVSTIFPDVKPLQPSLQLASQSESVELKGYDEEQVRLMDEACIVLDEDDNEIGMASKKTCHLMSNIKKGLLHRAFSVFLFDSQNRLLLQQRASEKITYPNLWTNSCCSHPLAIAGETGSPIQNAMMGAKRAAQRKLQHELGIKPEYVPLESLQFMTRMKYLAPCNSKWGEYELDYIFILQADVDLKINRNEIRDYRYVTQQELEDMLHDPSLQFTPWFSLIKNAMLANWWDGLNSGSLDSQMNDQKLHLLG